MADAASTVDAKSDPLNETRPKPTIKDVQPDASATKNAEMSSKGGRGLPFSPFRRAGLLSRLTFAFVGSLLERGREYTLMPQDLDQLDKRDDAAMVTNNLERAWNAERASAAAAGREPSLWRALYRSETNFSTFWVALVWAFGESTTRVSQPVVMGQLVRWISQGGSKTQGYSEGVRWALVLIAVAFCQVIIHHQLYWTTMRGGWNCKQAATGLVQRKMLRLSACGRMASNAIVNLVSNDVARFDAACTRGPFGITAPCELIAVFIIMYFQLGLYSALAGTSVLLLTLPLQIYFGKRFAVQRRITAGVTDKRVRKTGEMFSGISTVKAYCWERPLSAHVGELRDAERASIFVSQRMKAYNITFYIATPALATLATFSVFWAQGRRLEVASVFTTIALLQVLRVTVGKQFAGFIEAAPECLVAVSRIKRFLLQPEAAVHARGVTVTANETANDSTAGEAQGLLEQSEEKRTGGVAMQRLGTRGAGGPGEQIASDAAIVFKNATFTFDVQQQQQRMGNPQLKIEEAKRGASDENHRNAVTDVTLAVPKGALAIVVGPVGAGKSSFLSAALGELRLVSGSVCVKQDACLCAQNAWIMAGSLRQNVLFGSQMDAKRYNRVVTACGLRPDLEQLQDGDKTMLGERGVNLSGGQKARVALARAAYSRAGLCLLDDPLSAVDPHVMERLFRDCICGVLRAEGRTVVLVTHHLQYARDADMLIVLDSEGRVAFAGPPGECPDTTLTLEPEAKRKPAGDSTVADTDERREQQDEPRGENVAKGEKKTRTVTRFIKKEERETGEVAGSTYIQYARLAGLCMVSLCFFLFVVTQGVVLTSEFWLKIWAEADDQRDVTFLYVYIGLALGVVVIATIRSVLFYEVNLRGASHLHDRSFLAVLRSPMGFFHSNPLGRVLNKFSSDLGQIDELLPPVLFDVLQLGLGSLAAFVMVCVAVPWLAILILPLSFAFVQLRQTFLASARELKRMESIAKSPIYAAFAAQLRGLVTLRAFRAGPRLSQEFLDSLDAYGRAWISWLLVSRWLGFRLDSLAFCVLASCAVGAVITSSTADPGLVGIALTYAIMLSGGFQYLVRQSARAETMMTSVERMMYYMRLPAEGDWTRPDDSKLPKGWPVNGKLSVESLEMRYRIDLPLVLKGVNVQIPARAKVGIVGRTGSGKSSLLNALLRLCSPSGGRVMLDGVDVAALGLHQLRAAVAWIPQEPHLFSGSLRANLDPFARATDADLWAALGAVQLNTVIKALPGRLDAPVRDGGSNFSVGQRQLLSLARALVSKARVVVLDEATANIDMETDAKIQAVIKCADGDFKDRTVLMVAHRLNTVADCDLIVVMDNGRVAEAGKPAELAQREGGVFAGMLRAAGGSLLERLSRRGGSGAGSAAESESLFEEKKEQ